jgi:hypothetical protein
VRGSFPTPGLRYPEDPDFSRDRSRVFIQEDTGETPVIREITCRRRRVF